VRVGKPELKSELGGANKYWVYEIVGEDKFSSFKVCRRFSDFVVLKQALINRWPGCYSPSLPEKKFLGNNEIPFLEVRRTGLQNFLTTLTQFSHLWYSDVAFFVIVGASAVYQERQSGCGEEFG
jgi:hypothetical protein